MRCWLSLLFAFASIFFSCARHKDTSDESPPLAEKISICSEGWLQFARSYSFLMSMQLTEKEADRMMEVTAKENPVDLHPYHSGLKKRFVKLGFVKGDEVLLQKFKFGSNTDTSFHNSSNRDIRIQFVRDTLTERANKLLVFQGQDSAEIRTEPYMELKYAFLDIIPGGNKEIVMMIEGHVSNNDLYYFEVFEVKTRD